MSAPPGVHSVDASYDGVPLTVYVVEGERLSLIDAGVAGTPAQHILPALARLGAGPADLDWIVNTHAHHDHVGGNAPLRAASPRLRIAVSELDAGWAESPRRYMAGLYDAGFPGIWDPPPALRERVQRLFGAGAAVDRRLRDGDVIELGAGRRLRVVAAPAHSPGHVLAHDEDSGVLFAGDAIQRRGTEIDGRPWLFPLYTGVETYLRSLEAIRASGARWVCTAHFGVLAGTELDALLADAEAFVAELDTLLAGLLAQRGSVALADAVEAVLARWPGYDPGLQVYATCAAHFDRMAAAGAAVAWVHGDVKGWAAPGESRARPGPA